MWTRSYWRWSPLVDSCVRCVEDSASLKVVFFCLPEELCTLKKNSAPRI